MKNLRKTLASVAIMAALVAGCQTNSPTPEVVVVKKPDPITPADTTKKDTTKVVVIPPTPVSPKVIAGQKCYEARVIAAMGYTGIVIQVLGDSIGVKSEVTVMENGLSVDKQFSNVLTVGNKERDAKFHTFISKSSKIYFTVEKFEENVKSGFGWPWSFGPWGGFRCASRGVYFSSYSNESCKP